MSVPIATINQLLYTRTRYRLQIAIFMRTSGRLRAWTDQASKHCAGTHDSGTIPYSSQFGLSGQDTVTNDSDMVLPAISSSRNPVIMWFHHHGMPIATARRSAMTLPLRS
jgi:hypothetical protein